MLEFHYMVREEELELKAIYLQEIKFKKVSKCFCGSRFEQLSRFDRFGLPFGTQICRSCG